MSTDAAAHSIARAQEEVAAALAILLDPATSPRSAEIHLLQAWRLLYTGEVGERSTDDDGALVAWIEASAPTLSEHARQRAAALVTQLAQDLGRPLTQRASSRSRRELLRHARELGRALEDHGRRLRGASALGREWLVRGAAAAATLGLVAAFLITIRAEPDVGSGPWRASLYPTRDFEGEPTSMRYPDIDFEWGTGSPHEQLAGNVFSGKWDTCLVVQEGLTPLFVLQSDDGSRLLVDGQVVVDAWSGGARRQAQGQVELAPGVHHLELHYFELSGVASLHLRASLRGEKPAPIPASVLRYPGHALGSSNPCGALSD